MSCKILYFKVQTQVNMEVFWKGLWVLWSKMKTTDTSNLASVTTVGTGVKHILASTLSPKRAMQLWTAVSERKRIVCLHQMLRKNVMVQTVH